MQNNGQYDVEIFLQLIMSLYDSLSAVRSEQNFNTVEYLLDKDLPEARRKISEYSSNVPRDNFVLSHKAQNYTVFRVYIDSLYSKGVRLYYSKFEPSRKHATLCIIHGYGQSSDNYIQMAEYFAKNGFVVNMIDLRGFGYSGGQRVFQSFRGILSDIENLLRRCCQKGLPTYLLGHGFGSLLILALLQENPDLPLSGVISMSPLFKFPCFKNMSLVGKTVLYLLSKVWSYMLINNMINPTALTNNPKKIKYCLDGVFNYQFLSISMATAHHHLSQKVLEDAHKFKYPLLMLYGMKDSVQPIQDVKSFYRSVASKEKSSFVFKNGYHHLHDDQNAEKDLYPKIIDWILDESSDKNKIKWTVTTPFNLRVIKSIPSSLKYTVLVLVPILVGLLFKIISCIRARATR